MGPAHPPVGYASHEDKAWAMMIHFGGALALFLPGLIGLLVRGGQSRTVRAHAVDALNFQIPWTGLLAIAQVLATCTGGYLFFLPLGCWIVIAIFSIVGGIRANEGRQFRYPLGLPLLH